MATEDQTLVDSSELITSLKIRINVLESSQEEMRESVKLVTASMNQCLHGCGLDPYKEEMHQRCQRLTDKIENNKEILILHKHELENLIHEVQQKSDEKNLTVRQQLRLMFTTIVVIGIFFGGIIGTIQIQKVSQSEYNNHLAMYQDDRSVQLDRFNKFMDTYTANREKRDVKMDTMIERQQTFNEAISRRNVILEGQLDIIKAKLQMDAI